MRTAIFLLTLALLLNGAIAGFFYAYWSSVMVGLAAAAPDVGMAAMQAINATVRNARFAPAFFGPMLILPLAGIASWRVGRSASTLWVALALLAYGIGAFGITVLQNVPLNNRLAPIPPVGSDAVALWNAYVADWGFWNGIRTAFSFVALLAVGAALLSLVIGKRSPTKADLT